MTVSRRKFIAGSTAMAAATLSAGFSPAFALAPMAGAQIAGVHRFKVGDAEVTAVLDGYIDLDPALLPKAAPEEVADLLAANFLPAGKVRGAVNTYVINRSDKTILVDTGGANLLGPTMGRLGANLEAAGFNPADIDLIVMTHLHPDHVGGLAPEGSATFANAQLVVHQADVDFWTNEEIMNSVPENVQPFFKAAQASLAAYEGRVVPFSADGEISAGVQSMHLPGHTPGHCGFVVDGDEPLLIWGDIVHATPLQFPHPEWAIAFDVDQDQAIATRQNVFDMTAADRLRIAGMHIAFPGVGHVTKAGSGYAFVPEQWRYEIGG